ncbi:kinase-like protein [Daldinia caldariorum]|uniref:kinase-like protein n=1 Tax=Daldinia caldariorum TaxID=326644 RepID=UPI002007EB69|nr:kinase-like protein [Daldinia caldariorum]KAI1464367.1 kinase-like protein [Daldinia caldariorum]
MCICFSCKNILPRTSYSVDEFSKGSGVGRCNDCISGKRIENASVAEFDSGRYNISRNGVTSYFELGQPFSNGSYRWVALATYTSGPREGQSFVVKWFKARFVYEPHHYNLDIKAVHKALEIVNLFNNHKIINKTIRLNVPGVWIFTTASGLWAGRYVLCEPFIKNYQKFNSSTGWTDTSSTWGEVMQALSHFSYHITDGQFVLCDLQGGIYRHQAILSDPVILSQNIEYEVTDLGPRGITSFFSHHRCNAFCRLDWKMPAGTARIFDPAPGTALRGYIVPTRQSRPMDTPYYSPLRY